MPVIFQNIKAFILNFNGILLPKSRVLDEELNDIYYDVYCFDGRLEPHHDRMNIKKDIMLLKQDFGKSINEYKDLHKVEEPVNG